MIDQKTGDYQTFRRWQVVADDQVPELGTELTLQEAHERALPCSRAMSGKSRSKTPCSGGLLPRRPSR